MWKYLVYICFMLSVEAGIEDLEEQIARQVQSLKGLNSLQDLGRKINEDVAHSLQPLQNLGQRIQSQVQKSLEPVDALQIKEQMMHGIGGTTIASFGNLNSKKLLIRENKIYSCLGTIPDNQATCLGRLEEFRVQEQRDYCYSTSFVNIDNYLCISSSEHAVLTFTAVNGQYKCKTNNNVGSLLITLEAYKQLCGNRLPWQVFYKYYANVNSPYQVPIPNGNPYVRCLNNQVGICIFEGPITTNNGNTVSVISSGNQNIHISY